MKSLLSLLFCALLMSSPSFAADLISSKKMDNVFFGIVKPGLEKPRTASDYITGAECTASSEIFNSTFSGSGYLKIPAATRKLKPLKIVCSYNGQQKRFTIESDKVFLAKPAHRAIIRKGSKIKDPAKNAAYVNEQKAKLKYWGYGNSIIVNF